MGGGSEGGGRGALATLCLVSILFLSAIPAFAQLKDTDWLTYGGNHASWRYSELNQITTANTRVAATPASA